MELEDITVGVWTPVDEKNDYIRKSNIISYSNELILEGLEKMNKNYSLLNIEEMCKRKVYQLEDEFEKHGMNFFDHHGNIQRLIRNDLSLITQDATMELGKIVEGLSITHPGFITSSKILSKKLFSVLSKKYKELYSKAENYDIKSNLRHIIFDYYRDKRYWIFTPGSFISAWEKQKEELKQLGYESFINENEVEILKLIKIQEEKSKAFDIEYHKNNKQLSDDEIQIELERLEKEREALKQQYPEEESKYNL